MTPLEWNEIEQELESTPTPQPPADLLSKIQAEIPSGAELAAESEVPPTAAAKPHKSTSRRSWLIAASALIAVSASFLAYRVGQEDPSREGAVVQESLSVDEQDRLRVAPYLGLETEPTRDAALKRKPTPEERDNRQSGPRSEPTLDELANVATPEPARTSPGPGVIVADKTPTLTIGSRSKASRAADSSRKQEVSRSEQKPSDRPSARDRAQLEALGYLSDNDSAASSTMRSKENPATEPVQDGPVLTPVRNGLRQPTAIAPISPGLTRTPLPGTLHISGHPTLENFAANDAPYDDVYFKGYGTNPFVDTEDDPLSTFGLDVDSGSYTVARRYLRDGSLPPADAVRVEEFVNYFDYRDTPPRAGDFALTAEAAPSLFGGGPRHYLVRFNVAGRTVSDRNRTPATLVFVVDVSGSMRQGGRLELVKKSLGLLLDELRPDDRVGLVIYGSTAEVVLEPTNDHRRIRNGIQQLQPGGSTNAEEGLLAAYQLLSNHRAGAFDRDRDDRFADDDRPSPGLAGMPKRDRIYRIILCSDGVANVGNTGPESILERIGEEAQTGIALTTVGFGMGNYNDVLMEQLADRGDGAYAYVDTLLEAKRIFVENLTGTLQTIASDAKIQVEFDPKTVSRYRLLGYENRAIADEDFRNDKVDAGEVGAGHTVTALYEIKLHPDVKPRGEIAKVNLRYRSKANGQIEETSTKIRVREIEESWNDASPALRLASIVAEFAELLKGSYWTEGSSFQEVLPHAQRVSAEYAGDPEVAELVALIGAASRLSPEKR